MALVFSDGFGGQGCVVAVIEVRFVEDPDLNARGFNEVSGIQQGRFILYREEDEVRVSRASEVTSRFVSGVCGLDGNLIVRLVGVDDDVDVTNLVAGHEKLLGW